MKYTPSEIADILKCEAHIFNPDAAVMYLSTDTRTIL